MPSDHFPDLLIIGAGITGLTLAWTYRQAFPSARITLIDKENAVAQHASGRNSGVLHAGFYYSPDSLKARLCQQGNQRMQAFCREHGLALAVCGKWVVTASQEEVPRLRQLYERGLRNGVPLQWCTAAELSAAEPEARTVDYALFSPTTATVDPVQVCDFLYQMLLKQGVSFVFDTRFERRDAHRGVRTSRGVFYPKRVVNCAGLYADRIATAFGVHHPYTLLPFKGLYLDYCGDSDLLQGHLYPVPDPRQPFLGVHYTRTVQGRLKIGPTAIPALWRENYQGMSRFQLRELTEILWHEAGLFLSNRFGFRDLALQEIQKYWPPLFAQRAEHLTHRSVAKHFGASLKPGIRAQLFDKRSRALVSDFIVEDDGYALHVLNAVSPAFTCSFAFAEHLCNHYLVST